MKVPLAKLLVKTLPVLILPVVLDTIQSLAEEKLSSQFRLH